MTGKRTNDALEIERIVETYSDMLLRIALHQVGSHSEAEDILQTVFLRLLRSGFTSEDPEHEKAWLIRVTINLCKDYLKSPRHQRTAAVSQVPDESVYQVYESADAHLQEMELLQTVKTLPPNYRDAVYLYYYENYSVGDIAKVLGAKDSTVMSWLHRGRALLKSTLEGGMEL